MIKKSYFAIQIAFAYFLLGLFSCDNKSCEDSSVVRDWAAKFTSVAGSVSTNSKFQVGCGIVNAFLGEASNMCKQENAICPPSQRGTDAQYRADGNSEWQNVNFQDGNGQTFDVIVDGVPAISPKEQAAGENNIMFRTPGQYRFITLANLERLAEANLNNNESMSNVGNKGGRFDSNTMESGIVYVYDPTGKSKPAKSDEMVIIDILSSKTEIVK